MCKKVLLVMNRERSRQFCFVDLEKSFRSLIKMLHNDHSNSGD